jgi:hypothetical protein
MSKNVSNVEILTFNDTKKAALTLYKAFDNDDVARFVSRHLENDPARKREIDLQMYEAYINSHIMKGLVIGIKGDNHEEKDIYETVSIWEKPNADITDYLTLIRSGFAKVAWNTGAEGRRRVFSIMFKILHDSFHEITDCDPNGSNTWTLVYLGSTPDARGKGNVRKVFEYMFQEHIDPTGANAYLESSSVVNFPIYEKFGFRAVRDIWLGDKNDPSDSARMDVMIRGPKGETWKYLDVAREKFNYEVHENSIAK